MLIRRLVWGLRNEGLKVGLFGTFRREFTDVSRQKIKIFSHSSKSYCFYAYLNCFLIFGRVKNIIKERYHAILKKFPTDT